MNINPKKYPWQINNTVANVSALPISTRINIFWQRLIRWEFWPHYVFYIPILIWILFLAIRYRSPTIFILANPGIELGGLVGEHKHHTLLQLQEKTPELVAKTLYVPKADENKPNWRSYLIQNFITAQNINFPIVLKPNIGQRGRGVFIAHSAADVDSYLKKFSEEIIVQEYLSGEEFGVFVSRSPTKNKIKIISIVKKSFPCVYGDGKKTLGELILSDARAKLITPLLYKKWAENWHIIPEKDAKIDLVEIGAHCRGSLFEDAGYLQTDELLNTLNKVTYAIEGFHFGRIDLRSANINTFQQGLAIKIMEVNGVSAESAHIYHPGASLFSAYKAMFSQWSQAYLMGAENRLYYKNKQNIKGDININPPRLIDLWLASRADNIREQLWF